ncbi:MAG: homoserine O-acetyltransferase, partial [Saprospiraceae bacterium]|nr:homoserine O-acetyltransferase [Saprospiraceae bacterium]
PLEWWPDLVGPGKVIDTDAHFVVCANIIGSSYGSTNPDAINPATNKYYGTDFPLVTNRDIAKSFNLLRLHLKVDKVKLGIGGSMGGQQLLEWSILEPHVFEKITVLAANARHSPWGIAFNESQRMALTADPGFADYSNPEGGKAGLEAARAIAMLSYRNYKAYESTQSEQISQLDDFRASGYQRYQGQKLSKRFSPTCYWSLTRTMDSHDLGRNRGGVQKALRQIVAKTLIISISSDVLFPPSEQQTLYRYIPGSELVTIESDFGHDGFLVEGKKITQLLRQFLEGKCPNPPKRISNEISFAERKNKMWVPGCEAF